MTTPPSRFSVPALADLPPEDMRSRILEVQARSGFTCPTCSWRWRTAPTNGAPSPTTTR